MTDAKTDSQAYRHYIEGRIRSAHPVEIVHLLYQVAMDNLRSAIALLRSGDHIGRSRVVTKAQTAVHELMAALDPAASAAMCRNLAELYDYVLREIITGHMRQSEEAFENALGVLTTLSEGWSGVKTNVLGDDKSPEGELQSEPEEQLEAAPEKQVSRLYSEPQSPATGQDWSC
jgi:flagellar biosynthetic protein FliS